MDSGGILVIGDVMLDLYWHGRVSRISPEAPVPILAHQREEVRLGGAANVAANLLALQKPVQLFGLYGDDDNATKLQQQLLFQGIDHQLLKDASAPTIVKLRLLQEIQQIARIDWEKPFDEHSATKLFKAFQQQLHNLPQKPQAIILSDYAKGTLADPQAYIRLAREQQIPIIVDPKGSDFTRYKGCFCLTPNEAEFIAVVGSVSDANFADKMQQLAEQLQLQCLLVTRGSEGMMLYCQGNCSKLDTTAQSVFDVSGAAIPSLLILPRI